MSEPVEDITPGTRLAAGEWSQQASEGDLLEQATLAEPGEEPVDVPVELHRGLEVNDYDAVEQARTAQFDDDYD